jgi:hypothetical protein
MTMREEHLRAASCVGMTLALAGCGTWLNEEHCVFEGGDRGCAAGWSCVVVIGGGEVPDAVNGCLDANEAAALDPERYLHLRYGLPRSLEAENDVLQSDSVQGILAREIAARGLEDVCSDVEGVVSFDGWTELDLVFEARRRLEGLRHERKVRDEDAAVTATAAIAVLDLYASIDAWTEACEEEPEEGSSSGSEAGETTDETTTDPGSTTEAPACAASEDCADPAPFCDEVTGECVSCDAMPSPDEACAELDPTTPICVDGGCVQCTVTATAACQGQICDAGTNICVPCTAHAQCQAACDLATGECFPPDLVVHVGPGQEFDTIGDAIASLSFTDRGTIIIHQDAYNESVVVGDAIRLALLAAPGDIPTWYTTSGSQLTIQSDAAVFVEGLRLYGNSYGAGFTMNGGFAWLDRVQLVNNDIGAQITNGAQVVMRNCMLGHLVGLGYDALLVDSASASILYSTLIGDADLGNGLYCDLASSVTVRNSIIANYSGNPIECEFADIAYSATTGTVTGDGNHDVGAAELSWFSDYSSGDFHLIPGAANVFADIAQWQTGDPPTDLDGDPRPSIDGASDYPGADVPHP